MTYDHLVGLGDNCVPAFHMKRCGVRTAAYPFDQTFSTHPMIMKMLTTDFAGTFTNNITLTCENTGFEAHHVDFIDPVFVEQHNRRVNRFRALRQAGKILFIRGINHKVDCDTLQQQHAELLGALHDYGFNECRLVFALHRMHGGGHPDLYEMAGDDDPVHEWWSWNHKNWADFLDLMKQDLKHD